MRVQIEPKELRKDDVFYGGPDTKSPRKFKFMHEGVVVYTNINDNPVALRDGEEVWVELVPELKCGSTVKLGGEKYVIQSWSYDVPYGYDVGFRYHPITAEIKLVKV